jgi:putative transposase
VILSHHISLDPTEEQKIFFAKACGVARFSWNWALNEWEKQYKEGKKPNSFSLKKQFNAIKEKEFPWIFESPKDANQTPFSNLQKAYKSWWKAIKKGDKRLQKPRFKKKGVRDSFYISNSVFKTDENYIKLPLIGWVRMNESLRFDGKIMSGTISREADKWFISISVEVEDYKKQRISDNKIGIDLGLKNTIVTSDNQVFQAPKPLKKYQRLLKIRQRSLSRKKKGSKNRLKAIKRVQKTHVKIKNIRSDWQHKITTKLCRENQTICLEDLNIAGMMKSNLAKSLSDVGLGGIRRQLKYKSEIYGCDLKIIDRWYPSTKTCSNCGHKKDTIALSERVFKCDHCGFQIDRDLNAAKNILAVGLTVIDCGQKSSGFLAKENETGLDEAVNKMEANSFLLTN